MEEMSRSNFLTHVLRELPSFRSLLRHRSGANLILSKRLRRCELTPRISGKALVASIRLQFLNEVRSGRNLHFFNSE